MQAIFENLDALRSSLEHYRKTCNKDYDDLSSKYDILEKEHEIAVDKIRKYDILKLQHDIAVEKIRDMEQEKIEFSKVSHIISLERENARLKKELEKLVEDDDNEESFYERKIKHIAYYISANDNSSIHEKLEDNTVGAKIGYLQTINGKTKAVWE